MSQSSLSLTNFQVEKLRCIGGAGRASPYRITTYRGMSLGSVGLIAQYGWEARNDETYDVPRNSLMQRLFGRRQTARG